MTATKALPTSRNAGGLELAAGSFIDSIKQSDQITIEEQVFPSKSRPLVLDLVLTLGYLSLTDGFTLLRAGFVSDYELTKIFRLTPLDYMSKNVRVPANLLVYRKPQLLLVDSTTPLQRELREESSMKGDKQELGSVFHADDHRMAFAQAVVSGKRDWVELLLYPGGIENPFLDPSENDNYALMEALSWGHRGIVDLLLRHSTVKPSADDYRFIQLITDDT